jgi:hypothetical protein
LLTQEDGCPIGSYPEKDGCHSKLKGHQTMVLFGAGIALLFAAALIPYTGDSPGRTLGARLGHGSETPA